MGNVTPTAMGAAAPLPGLPGRPPDAWGLIPSDVLRAIRQRAGYGPAFLYCILRSYDTPGRTASCFPSQKALAARGGIPERTVRWHLAQLKSIGAVIVTARGIPGGGRASSAYLFPALSEWPVASNGSVQQGPQAPSEEPKVEQAGNPLPVRGGANRQPVAGLGGANRQPVAGLGGANRQGAAALGGAKPASPCRVTGKPVAGFPPASPLSTLYQTSTRPPPPLIPPSAPFVARMMAIAPKAEVVAVQVIGGYVSRQEISGESQEALIGQVTGITRKHGQEAARRALTALACALRDGQRPREPDRLPNYFAPILRRVVKVWCEEQEQKAMWEQQHAAREARKRETLERNPGGQKPLHGGAAAEAAHQPLCLTVTAARLDLLRAQGAQIMRESRVDAQSRGIRADGQLGG